MKRKDNIKKEKRKPRIGYKPNPETIIYNDNNCDWTMVVTNPRACRKIEDK
jgi:hypothetical protein